jgi:hypothetical protein
LGTEILEERRLLSATLSHTPSVIALIAKSTVAQTHATALTVSVSDAAAGPLASGEPAAAGQKLTFALTVAANPPLATTTKPPLPSGKVTITDTFTANGKTTSTSVATVDLAGGTGSFSTSGLAIGIHTLLFSYSGDTDYAATTATVTQSIVANASTITLRVLKGITRLTYVNHVFSTIPSQTLVVKVSPSADTTTSKLSLAGTATIYNAAGGELLGSVALNADGVGSFTTTDLSGLSQIETVFDGNANFSAVSVGTTISKPKA